MSRETFANIEWRIEDIQSVHPDWSSEECLCWWQANEKWFKDTLTQYGNEILSNM